jgi:predicted TIM-barrel enzyme
VHPILIGSGITIENIGTYWNLADGFIVGSHFKEKGIWSNPLSENRIRMFMEKVKNLRIEN